jgi:pyrroline-5-carboxylate reductase
MTQRCIGFIGTGRIAQALIAGLVRDPDTFIEGYDKDPLVVKTVSSTFGILQKHSLAELAHDSTILIIAIKPYQVGEMLEELKPFLTPEHLIISVAAGISTEFIRSRTLEEMRVVRVMPNTPAFVGEGMTAVCKGQRATDEDLVQAKEIFSAIGKVAVVEESGMDAATGLSGSGPAYMFHIIASLAEGGMLCGLSHDDSMLLAAQTMLGAATMVLSSKLSPEELIRNVTTPGGTTEAGLKVMDQYNIRQILVDTVKAAAGRSRELMK